MPKNKAYSVEKNPSSKYRQRYELSMEMGAKKKGKKKK
jgi:hypothetical protein